MEAKRRLIKLLIDNQDNDLQFLREILNYLNLIGRYEFKVNYELFREYISNLENFVDTVDKCLQAKNEKESED